MLPPLDAIRHRPHSGGVGKGHPTDSDFICLSTQEAIEKVVAADSPGVVVRFIIYDGGFAVRSHEVKAASGQ